MLANRAIPQLLVRDERLAGYAADAFARLTGRPGVCDVTVGPGTTKLRGVLERLGLVSAAPSAAPARSPPRGGEEPNPPRRLGRRPPIPPTARSPPSGSRRPSGSR